MKTTEIAAKVILTSVCAWFAETENLVVEKARRHYVEICEKNACAVQCDCSFGEAG
jgi:hypothetical protein